MDDLLISIQHSIDDHEDDTFIELTRNIPIGTLELFSFGNIFFGDEYLFFRCNMMTFAVFNYNDFVVSNLLERGFVLEEDSIILAVVSDKSRIVNLFLRHDFERIMGTIHFEDFELSISVLKVLFPFISKEEQIERARSWADVLIPFIVETGLNNPTDILNYILTLDFMSFPDTTIFYLLEQGAEPDSELLEQTKSSFYTMNDMVEGSSVKNLINGWKREFKKSKGYLVNTFSKTNKSLQEYGILSDIMDYAGNFHVSDHHKTIAKIIITDEKENITFYDEIEKLDNSYIQLVHLPLKLSTILSNKYGEYKMIVKGIYKNQIYYDNPYKFAKIIIHTMDEELEHNFKIIHYDYISGYIFVEPWLLPCLLNQTITNDNGVSFTVVELIG